VDEDPYAPVQYARLAPVVQALMSRHPACGCITGHCDISPGRKTDPGPAFDWLALRQQLESVQHG
jgi:AmpD protein